MQQDLRVMIVTARILQFCADIFAVFGIVLFAYMYFHIFKDSPLEAISSPYFVVTILLPFLPAAILAWQANRKRKQIRALLEQQGKSP